MQSKFSKSKFSRIGLFPFVLALIFCSGIVFSAVIFNAYSEFRPIADDYGNMALAKQLGVADFTLGIINNSSSSVFAVIVVGIYFYLAAIMPWTFAYFPLVATFLVILFLLIIKVGNLLFERFRSYLALIALPFVFVIWSASLTTFGSSVDLNHFYSVFGWISNSPRSLFAWLAIGLVLTVDFTRKDRRTSVYIGYFLVGTLLGTLGAVESLVLVIVVVSSGLSQNGYLVRTAFKEKVFLSTLAGSLSGLAFTVLGPGSQNRAENSEYAINSISQITYITVGEFAKHWGETFGNFVYTLIFLVTVLITALILRINPSYSEDNLKSDMDYQQTNQFLKQRIVPLVVLWLSLSFLTALSSAFVYSAPWHVIGVRQVFLSIVVLLGLYIGMRVKKFNSFVGAISILLIVMLLVVGPIKIGISQIQQRNANWLLGPSPYGYMTDRDSQWVYEDALKLEPIAIELGKEFPVLDM